MRKFCLGIIGRCLACQPWTPIPDLYHRQLKLMLQEQENILLSVSIAGRSDLEPYARMKILHKKKLLDGVLYSARYVQGREPFLCSEKDDFGKSSYSLNPIFFKRFFRKKKTSYNGCDSVQYAFRARRSRDSHDLLDIPPAEEKQLNTSNRKLLGIPLHKVNLLIGKLCGLNSWVIAPEWLYFEKLRILCLDLKIPLFVLGPIPGVKNLENRNNQLLWQQMQKESKRKLLKHHIPNYFLHSLNDEKGKPLHKKDQGHLNAEGHAYLARELYPIISPWVKSILNAKDIQKSYL